jgi:hypothetical protein
MGQTPCAGFFENGHLFFIAAMMSREPDVDARYMFSMFRQGRESKTNRSFPDFGLSIRQKYSTLETTLATASMTVRPAACWQGEDDLKD